VNDLLLSVSRRFEGVTDLVIDLLGPAASYDASEDDSGKTGHREEGRV